MSVEVQRARRQSSHACTYFSCLALSRGALRYSNETLTSALRPRVQKSSKGDLMGITGLVKVLRECRILDNRFDMNDAGVVFYRILAGSDGGERCYFTLPLGRACVRLRVCWCMLIEIRNWRCARECCAGVYQVGCRRCFGRRCCIFGKLVCSL